jgi:site-specific recombinase XerC
VRAGGDTKTRKSRRALILPQRVIDAFQALWETRTGGHAEISECACLVFVTRTGKALEAHNVRRDFGRSTAPGLAAREWVPRELRQSFVSLLSDAQVPLEVITRLSPGLFAGGRSRI